MDSKTTLSITEARKKLFTLAENVQRPSLYYTLTEKGKAKAVLMSVEEFESWQETLEVMRDFPDLKKTIKEVEKDLKAGRYKVYTTLDELEHDLLPQNKTKRRKKST
jgi:prevent-host-death family protein